MSTATVLYGTESGNAEMTADDIAAALTDAGFNSTAIDMGDWSIDGLAEDQLVVLVSSTYGEGDLPASAVPFHDALSERTPDLSAVRFAAFGLGDSSYENYNNGIDTLIDAVTKLGATQIGETGRHDAASGVASTEAATKWIAEILNLL